jgi:hypothetical protein
VKDKDKIIEQLEDQIESLTEENESLWFLLEELQNSDLALFDEKITKAMNELKIRNLMTVTKVAEG